MLSLCFKDEIGELDFGGSVSTNAASLADKMQGRVYLLGQDLAFTDGFAHAKGAVLEERLNYTESRFKRRELHNYRQIHYLPPVRVRGLKGEIHTANEKLQIFNKWFSDKSADHDWTNLTSSGAEIKGMKYASFEETFKQMPDSVADAVTNTIKEIRLKIKEPARIDKNLLMLTVSDIITGLGDVVEIYKEGFELSSRLYRLVKEKSKNHDLAERSR